MGPEALAQRCNSFDLHQLSKLKDLNRKRNQTSIALQVVIINTTLISTEVVAFFEIRDQLNSIKISNNKALAKKMSFKSGMMFRMPNKNHFSNMLRQDFTSCSFN